MEYKDILDEYIKSEESADMEALAKITEKFVESVEAKDESLVQDFICNLKTYIDPFRDRKTIEKSVAKMKNKDGSVGAHWNYDTVSEVSKKHNVEDVEEFYYVLNMMWSDYYKAGRSDNEYIELAIDFIDDSDAPNDKALRYFRMTHY